MKRSSMLGWMALVAAGVLAGCTGDAGSRTDETTRALLAQPGAAGLATPIDTTLLEGGEPTLTIDLLGVNTGSVEAPVKVIEFVDFGCGFCRRFQLETFPTVREEFIETGMLEWKLLPFVSGVFANSHVVTLGAECALAQDPRVFAAFTNRLWVQQSDWKGSADPEALAREWMAELGADVAAYDSCLLDATRQQRVTSATALADQLGIRATPTFWIVGAGPVQGALPIDAFRQLFTQIHDEITGDAN